LPGFRSRGGGSVQLRWLATTAAHEKLLTAFAGGTLPDVFMLARDWVTEFATLGALSPAPVALLDDQFPGAKRDVSWRGAAWAVPWTVDSQVQYHRRDILHAAGYPAPPTQWQVWKEMLRAIRRGRSDGFPLLMQLNWPEHLMNMAASAGAFPLADRESRGAFRSPEFRDALRFYKSLFDERLAPLATGTDVPDPAAELARGWIAVYPAGAWTAADIRRRQLMPDDQWRIAMMPSVNGAPRTIVGGAVLAVSHGTSRPDAAWDLVRYLTAPVTQAAFHRIAGTLPSRPSAWASSALQEDPIAMQFEPTLTQAIAMPTIPEWPRIATEVQAIAEHMVRGDVTIIQATAAMDARADALLAKRRWLLDRGRAV
jgi:multiple sugar transport system substrate-binding protein